MPTEEPCDLAYDFGDGILYLDDYPEGFPKPGMITDFAGMFIVYNHLTLGILVVVVMITLYVSL